MATIFGTSLAPVGSVADAPGLRLDGAASITSAVVGSTTYVYVAGQNDDNIQVFTLDGTGTLTPIVPPPGPVTVSQAFALTTFEVDGTPFLAALDPMTDLLAVYRLRDDPVAPLFPQDSASAGPNSPLSNPSALVAVETGGGTYLYVAGNTPTMGGVEAFRVTSDGNLLSLGMTTISDFTLFGERHLAPFSLSGTEYLVDIVPSISSINIAEVSAADGSLPRVENVVGLPFELGPAAAR